MATIISSLLKEYEGCETILVSKNSIDKAGEQYKKDITDPQSLKLINCYRLLRLNKLGEVLSDVLTSATIGNFVVVARLKRLKSIARKLLRSGKMKLSQMDDIIGVRIICGSLTDALKFSSKFVSCQSYKHTHNYVDIPRATGYRGIHVILRFPCELPSGTVQFTSEVQIRSYYQHVWAARSEGYGEQVKEGNGPEDICRFLQRLSRKIRKKEEDSPDAQQARLPEMTNGRYLSVVGYREGYLPTTDKYVGEYGRAYKQLLYLEDIPSINPLLLVGKNETLEMTHPLFMGTSLRLEPWMPSPPNAT